MSNNHSNVTQQAKELENRWKTDPRWKGVERNYSAEDVIRLRGSVMIEHTLARRGAERLWKSLNQDGYIRTFGAYTGMQATNMVKAGLQALYLSGWQVAGDANLAGQTFPDQSLYPSNSVPAVVKRLNNALTRADQIQTLDGSGDLDYFAPIVADAEAGFGGAIHAYELMRWMIEAGAAGVHYEDQLSAAKKCGHMGGKVLIPSSMFVQTLNAARLAADVLDVPTILCARTDARAATLLTSDIDERDAKYTTGTRTSEGFFEINDGFDAAVSRGLNYAPYADLLWCETSEPDLDEAIAFADAIHKEFPDMMLAYNCSPSFNWKGYLDDATIAKFQDELGKVGYKFQFITLAGWHMVNLNAFEFARAYKENGMTTFSQMQEQEFAAEKYGYTATKHQAEVGAGYFDEVLLSVSEGQASTGALSGSTESAQF
ncbi:MAG: isocitrate lyase [SAR202 cluster bacterium]|nr:isocitrate lyase [SAR202 cluster bacterium]